MIDIESTGATRTLRLDGRDARRVLAASPEDMREATRYALHRARVDEMLRMARAEPGLRASVPGNAYTIHTGASAIALAAATAKTVMYLNAGTANQPSVVEFSISFDGVTASATPALIELCYGTAATNSTPGTGSTTFTPLQVRGWPAQTSQNSAANSCTSEPTVLTTMKQWLVTPNGGLLIVQLPMGREATGLVTAATSGKQLAWRLTAPAIVNARGYVEYEE
jgi:hypothetical protein